MDIADEVKEFTGEVAEQARPWISRMARLGIASKGIVYFVMAFLIFQAARGLSSADVDVHTALLEISDQPYGRWVLLAVAVGLLGYVIWRFSQAIWDPSCRRPGFKGWGSRLKFAVNAIAYSVITVAALQFLTTPNPQENTTSRDLATQMLSWTAGRTVVGAAGVILMGVGVSHWINVFRAGFKKELEPGRASRQMRAWTIWLGRIGSAARGLVYSTVGFLLVQAAIFRIPYRAGGVGEAVRALAFSPYGPLILTLVALGLAAHAFHLLLAAFYNRVDIPSWD
jgi:hypothetical protein